jgi:hypothetical protein
MQSNYSPPIVIWFCYALGCAVVQGCSLCSPAVCLVFLETHNCSLQLCLCQFHGSGSCHQQRYPFQHVIVERNTTYHHLPLSVCVLMRWFTAVLQHCIQGSSMHNAQWCVGAPCKHCCHRVQWCVGLNQCLLASWLCMSDPCRAAGDEHLACCGGMQSNPSPPYLGFRVVYDAQLLGHAQLAQTVLR